MAARVHHRVPGHRRRGDAVRASDRLEQGTTPTSSEADVEDAVPVWVYGPNRDPIYRPRRRFDFDAEHHLYVAQTTPRRVLKSITEIIRLDGHVDDEWFTDESRDRGTWVHAATARLDMSVDVEPHPLYEAYVAAYRAATDLMQSLHPIRWHAIEEPLAHPFYRYAGQPDRLYHWQDGVGPMEIKTGRACKHHALQTALQAMLAEQVLRVPAERQVRRCIYLQPTGRAKVVVHDNRMDFERALAMLEHILGRETW